LQSTRGLIERRITTKERREERNKERNQERMEEIKTKN
jgi:hypothetical protein